MWISNFRNLLGAGVFALAAVCAVPAGAADVKPAESQPQQGARDQVTQQGAQPLNNAPVWRDVRSGAPQTTQVRGVETNVLIQSQGETWRQIRNGPITVYGGLLVLAVPLAILAFFLWKGPIKVHGQLTGRKIPRLSAWDRYIHWTTAISWCVLAISGLILLFGKYILMPLIGGTLFSWLAQLAKILHNFIGPVFLLAAILMFVQYVGRNLPRGGDFAWLAKGGGLLTGEHVPSGFFNAGEKIVFWVGLTFFTIVVGASGLVMLFPNFDQGREVMQVSNIVHATAGVLYMAMMMGHIYLGSVGVEGAWEAMRYDGMVDEAWAKEHHEYWYNEVRSGRHGSAAPMAGVAGTRRD